MGSHVFMSVCVCMSMCLYGLYICVHMASHVFVKFVCAQVYAMRVWVVMRLCVHRYMLYVYG